MGTGTGKTRIGVLASKKLIEEGSVKAIHIVVPTTNLIRAWIAEFIKWGSEEILTRVKINCIQTSYKVDHDLVLGPEGIPPDNTLLIVDEVQTSLSPQFRALYRFQ